MESTSAFAFIGIGEGVIQLLLRVAIKLVARVFLLIDEEAFLGQMTRATTVRALVDLSAPRSVIYPAFQLLFQFVALPFQFVALPFQFVALLYNMI